MHKVHNARTKQKSLGAMLFVPALLAGGAIGYVASEQRHVSLSYLSPVLNIFNPSCRIKGNISINTGQPIYHVPGQMFYDETTIRPEFGERWFCSEGEARAAGWRRARR